MELFVIGIVVGLAIGIFSGLLGIGGGTVMVPIFRLAMGLDAVASTATSLFTIIPTSLAGGITHLHNKTCVPKLGVALGIGGAITSPIGVWLAQVAPPLAIMLAAAAVIAYSAYSMLRKAIALGDKANASPGTPTATSGNVAAASAVEPTETAAGETSAAENGIQAEAAQPADFEFGPKKLGVAAAIGALAGLISGFVGVGGGFIMVPLMLGLLNMPMRKASGTSLIAIMILAAPATIEQCLLGNVDYLIGISVACGSIPGAMLGAKLITKVPERALRFTFAGFLGIAAILLLVKEAGLLG